MTTRLTPAAGGRHGVPIACRKSSSSSIARLPPAASRDCSPGGAVAPPGRSARRRCPARYPTPPGPNARRHRACCDAVGHVTLMSVDVERRLLGAAPNCGARIASSTTAPASIGPIGIPAASHSLRRVAAGIGVDAFTGVLPRSHHAPSAPAISRRCRPFEVAWRVPSELCPSGAAWRWAPCWRPGLAF